jgi:hypothetical protein
MEIRLIRNSDVLRCKFCIFSPEHYREDGTCKCDDLTHRKMMIQEWGYDEHDFQDIPLRRAPDNG